jgi:hypothetical protein
MAGANIFVVYSSANGQNVTLSPRLGVGHVMPEYSADAKATLLAGSGISNGVMTANVKCSNCNSWNGGTMDFKASSNSWIYAIGAGSVVRSDDQDATIQQHSPSRASQFDWTISGAKGGSSVNPFVADVVPSSGNTTTGATTTSAAPSGTNTASPSPTSSTLPADNDLDSFNPDTFNRIAVIHGSLAGIAFVGIFPIGAILIRIGNFSNMVWVHAAMQALGYIIYAAAFGMGIWLTRTLQPDNHTHPLIGSVIFIVLLSQPITGWLHHRFFVRSGGRGKASVVHLTIGRATIVLGMINGGFGLYLAGVTGGAVIAYGVIAGIMFVLYMAAIVIGERRRKRATNGQTAAFDQDNSLRLHSFEAKNGSPTLEGGVTHVPKYN